MSIGSGSIPVGTAPFRADPLKTSPPAKSTLAPVFSGFSGFPVIFGPTRSKSRAHITGAPRPALFTVLGSGPAFDGPPLEQATVALSRTATAQCPPFFQRDCDTRPPLATLLYIPVASRRERATFDRLSTAPTLWYRSTRSSNRSPRSALQSRPALRWPDAAERTRRIRSMEDTACQAGRSLDL